VAAAERAAKEAAEAEVASDIARAKEAHEAEP